MYLWQVLSIASSLLSEKISLGILDSLGASLLRQAFQDIHSGPYSQLVQTAMASAELPVSSGLLSLSLSLNLE